MEDDFVEYHAREARTGGAVFHTFITTYGAPGEIHVFYEGGDDAAYYGTPIRFRSGDRRIHSYICGGKRAVSEVRDMISNGQYDEVIRLFFIDRDYDDLFGEQILIDDDTYISDGYSFENDLVCDASIDILACELSGLAAAGPEYDEVIKGFHDLQKQGHQQIASLMAWALALRARGDKVLLSNVQLGGVLRVTAGGEVSRRKRGFDKFCRACAPHAAPPSLAEVRRWRKTLLDMPVELAVRGKFHLWMFETYMQAILADVVPRAKTSGNKRAKIPAVVRHRLTIEALGGRARTPTSLADFLDRQLAA